RPARGPAAPVPAAVRRQDDPGRRGALRAAVRIRRARAAALAARLGRARQRPGRPAGILAVRQPHPPGPDLERRSSPIGWGEQSEPQRASTPGNGAGRMHPNVQRARSPGVSLGFAALTPTYAVLAPTRG